MKKLTLVTSILLSAIVNAQTVTDFDGNVYPVVTIGNQKWMAQNIRTTHFSDGSTITNAGFNNWYYFPLNDARYCEPIIPPNTTDTSALGFWYNYPAAGDSRNICPQGWHVATDAEWYQMVHYLDPNSDTSSLTTLESEIAGGMLKDTVLWISPNVGATNSTGFSAIPVSDISASIIWPAGYVCCQGGNASFWCGGTTWVPGTTCYYRYLDYMQANITRNTDNYSNGKSIRCVCDTLAVTSIQENQFLEKLQVYPNLAIDRITVSATNKSLGKIIIYNTLGGIVYTTTSIDNSKLIDVSHFSSGLYFVALPDLNRTIKIIRQ